MLLRINLDIANMFIPSLILIPLSNDLIPPKLRPNLGPPNPVDNTKQQDAHAHNGENVIRIALRVPVTIRRNERYDSEEHVGEQVQNSNGEIGVPWRGPTLTLGVMQVDEAGRDEAVDPSTGISVEIYNEVVGGPGGWG
jgi:hypothetical protein